MKDFQILLSLATIVVLSALDGHMAGLPVYGWAFRAVVGLLVLGQAVMMARLLSK